MALLTEYDVESFDIKLDDAYVRIRDISFNFPQDKYVDANVVFYANEEKRKAGKSFETQIISIPMIEFAETKMTYDDIFNTAYTYLKNKYRHSRDI